MTSTCKHHHEAPNETESISPEPSEEIEEKAIPFPLIGSGQSRLQSEFNYIGPIGKGGFGEVMKVQKLLDGRVYAIKRIQLNPRNPKLTKKIVREVKLLSRLDHENIVRYYNSWVEVMEMTSAAASKTESTSTDEDDEVDTATSSDKTRLLVTREASDPKQVTFDELPQKRLFGHFIRPNHSNSPLLPPMTIEPSTEASNSGWSFSHYVPDTDSDQSDDSDSDDLDGGDFGDEDNDDMFGTSFLPSEKGAWQISAEEEDSIVFEDSRAVYKDPEESKRNPKIGVKCQAINKAISLPSSENEKNQASHDEVDEPGAKKEKKMQLQFLYIQMEYCDKQTLRSAIDEGTLFKDSKRLWRMFREIIEGLLHIHSQAMIHRDLKPVNIFIHSNGHLKIGDFGLATTNMIPGGGTGSNQHLDPAPEMFNNTTQAGDTLDTSDLTGHVGTAMYVAPEINSGKSTTSYNQKVDIYSLGIIFFEMCYPPLQTGMERIKVLSSLRSKEILIPSEGKEIMNDTQINIIRWLLNHDPSKRPTSHELLTSDHLPPLQVSTNRFLNSRF